MKYVGEDGNADRVQSVECFKEWVATRKRRPKKPHESFRRVLTAHVAGVDSRKPFPKRVEVSLLRNLRRKEVWPCFKGEEVSIGVQGFRKEGHHEKISKKSPMVYQRTPRNSKIAKSKSKGTSDLKTRKRAVVEGVEHDDKVIHKIPKTTKHKICKPAELGPTLHNLRSRKIRQQQTATEKAKWMKITDAAAKTEDIEFKEVVLTAEEQMINDALNPSLPPRRMEEVEEARGEARAEDNDQPPSTKEIRVSPAEGVKANEATAESNLVTTSNDQLDVNQTLKDTDATVLLGDQLCMNQFPPRKNIGGMSGEQLNVCQSSMGWDVLERSVQDRPGSQWSMGTHLLTMNGAQSGVNQLRLNGNQSLLDVYRYNDQIQFPASYQSVQQQQQYGLVLGGSQWFGQTSGALFPSYQMMYSSSNDGRNQNGFSSPMYCPPIASRGINQTNNTILTNPKENRN